jgi:hypothetical protein
LPLPVTGCNAALLRAFAAQQAGDLQTWKIPLVACIHRFGFVYEPARKELVATLRYKLLTRPLSLETNGVSMRSFKNTPSLNTHMCGALVMLSLAFASASAADGDAPQQSLTPGMRVRILAPELSSGKLIGTVHQVSDSSVTLDVPGREASIRRSAPASALRAARRAADAVKS